jgi:hypothetical protein
MKSGERRLRLLLKAIRNLIKIESYAGKAGAFEEGAIVID